MADVIAKFQVSSVEHFSHPPKSFSVKLNAVYPSKDEQDMANLKENKSFSEATPSGQITMYVSNPAVYDVFKPGDEFYVEFTKKKKLTA